MFKTLFNPLGTLVYTLSKAKGKGQVVSVTNIHAMKMYYEHWDKAPCTLDSDIRWLLCHRKRI
jgi:hypothetical protein